MSAAPLPAGKVMLLVDADNVSADVMEQAVRSVMAEHGHLHVRRAYCTAEVALKHQQLFKRLSMRPMVNLAAGKNSTDIALAVDAMDLVMAERPQVVYLVSSDSDFAPLVHRLREKGCRVCGIGQQGKTGEETRAVYDHFVDLKHKASAGGAVEVAPPPLREPAPPAPAKKVAAKKTATKKVAAKKAAAKKTPAKKVAPAALKAAEPGQVTVSQILGAVPTLVEGQPLQLNDVAKRLHDAKLLGKNTSSLKLFKKFPHHFELLPPQAKQPHQVRYIPVS